MRFKTRGVLSLVFVLSMVVTPMVGWYVGGNKYISPATVSKTETRGGSVTLVMADEKRRPVVLNSPIHTRIPGRQRPVGNQIGVRVEK